MPDSRYGWYRYGRHTYDVPDIDRSPPDRDVGPDPHEVFGAGIALRTADDPDGAPWGFVVDASGDLAATSGYSEISKDLAWATAVDSSLLQGTLANANQRAELETEIERIAQDDDRIDDVEARVRLPGSAETPNASQWTGENIVDRPADVILVDLEVVTVIGTAQGITIPLSRR